VGKRLLLALLTSVRHCRCLRGACIQSALVSRPCRACITPRVTSASSSLEMARRRSKSEVSPYLSDLASCRETRLLGRQPHYWRQAVRSRASLLGLPSHICHTLLLIYWPHGQLVTISPRTPLRRSGKPVATRQAYCDLRQPAQCSWSSSTLCCCWLCRR
jgi:hypothetical protein